MLCARHDHRFDGVHGGYGVLQCYVLGMITDFMEFMVGMAYGSGTWKEKCY